MKIKGGFRHIKKSQKVRCPICSGFGNTITRARKDQECNCKGSGNVWLIDKAEGKYRALWSREYFYY